MTLLVVGSKDKKITCPGLKSSFEEGVSNLGSRLAIADFGLELTILYRNQILGG